MNLRPLLILPPIVIAMLGFNWMTRERPEDVTRQEETQLTVRAMEIEIEPVRATATGFGRVQTVRDWLAVSEVAARIEEIPGALAEGSIVEQGDVLFKIDVTDYELARQKAQANIAAVEAQIREIARQSENTQRSLLLEQRTLEVAQAEFDRISELVERGAATQATLDTTQKTLLAQQNAVLNLQNAMALYPAQTDSLKATRAVREAELREAERSIEKAVITAPFRARVATVNAEVGQSISVGSELLSLEDTSAVEVMVELQPSSFFPVLLAVRPEIEFPEGGVDTSAVISMLKNAGVTAEVRFSLGDLDAVWPADLVRVRGTLDTDTATMGIAVRVDDPLIGMPMLNRPRLDVGAYVSVVFETPPVDGWITIPRTAVRYNDDGTSFVYLADAEQRLSKREITKGPAMGQSILVRDGLEQGDIVVLSEPSPPVIGMALQVLMAGAES